MVDQVAGTRITGDQSSRSGKFTGIATVCPLCSANRNSRNRKLKCFWVWRPRAGWASFRCWHCGEHGWAGNGGPAPSPAELVTIRTETATQQRADEADRIHRALDLWDDTGPAEETIGWRYLTGPKADGFRGISPALVATVADGTLRFHPKCPFRNDSGSLVRVPALVGLMRHVETDAPRAVWRRPLTVEGRKAGKPRSLGPTKGAAIKLTADEDVSYGLHVGEGVETMLAAMGEGFAPAWACGSAGNLENLPVLAGVDALTIIVDHDQAGIEAADACSQRWRAAGREVFRILPNVAGSDMNDVVGGVS